MSLAWSLAATAASRPARQSASDDETVAMRLCVGCHDIGIIRTTRRSRQQWDEVIDNMVAKGARMTDPDYEAVMRHLLRNYGRVNVNSAVAADLVLATTLSVEDADRILEYRTAHGRFEDFDAVTEVPGIDLARLREARSAFSF